jgi:hypothetical protein
MAFWLKGIWIEKSIEMVNYANGKIYGLRSGQTEKIYVGSTAKKYLCDRKSLHVTNYRKWKSGTFSTKLSSFDILEFDDAEIYLIENYPCQNRDELRTREQYWINQNKEICVNKRPSFITLEQKRARNQAYDEKYKDEHREEINAKALLRSLRRIMCDCGIEYNYGHKSRHLASKKHTENMQTKK